MKAMRLWKGVRMREVAASADPDGPLRRVTLPASWDDSAAEALAALIPGEGPVSLAVSASVWQSMLAARAKQSGLGAEVPTALQRLLLARRMAPTAPVWRCEAGVVGFRVNAAAFHDPAGGLDVAGFAEAAALAGRACRLLSPAAPRYEVGLSGLDDLLAAAGLSYDCQDGRSAAACLAALLRAGVEQALEGEQQDLLATGPGWPAPPPACAIPGLAEAARAAHAALRRTPGVVPATGAFPADAADALLGVETAGIAPAFSPVRERRLTRAALDRLAASALSPESALATALEGGQPLPTAGRDAHEAMRAAVAPYLDTVASVPTALPRPPPAVLYEALPPRHASTVRKVTVGGHRVFLRTAEYADGRLGEIGLSLPRETATVRALADCVAQAVTIGLQHGVTLDEFVEAFTLTRFGPSGAVEGDEEVDRATSVLDYVFRSLSARYLGKALPTPAIDEPEGDAPSLPLDLPAGRRGLRLVA